MIKTEIKKILYRKQFWIILVVMMLFIFLDFFFTCQAYQGKDLLEIPSAYKLMILNNYATPPTGVLFKSFLFFMAATLIGSDLFAEELELGVHNDLLTRTSRKKLVFSKGCAVVLVVFCVIVFCLLISQILAISAFPLQGNFTDQIAYNSLMQPDKTRIGSYFETYFPYLNNVVFALLRGLTGAVAAFLAFCLTFVTGIKRYVLLLVPMLFYMAYSLSTATIGGQVENIWLSEIIETNILNMNGYGSIWMNAAFLLVQVVAGGLLIWKGTRQDETFL